MTKTPKTYTISFQEIRDFVEKQPKDTSYVGECVSPMRCLVARAVQEKYRPHAVLVVSGGSVQITFQGRSKEPKWHDVLTGQDRIKISQLIHMFDNLGLKDGLATKADVLPLFEKVVG